MSKHSNDNKPPSRLIKQTLIATSLALGLVACASPSTQDEQTFRLRANSHALMQTSAADVEAEIEFGRDIAARVLGRYGLLHDKQKNRYINLVGTALAAHSSRTELNYHFAILDSDKVNAYSAPGGYIFITRGALELAQDEAELAAILAHEIAHITQRHIVNALNIKAQDKSAGASIGRLLSAGTDTGRVAFFQAVDQAVAILFEKGYSQQNELDSDRVATLLLAEAGYDPLALRRYLQRAQDADHQDSEINTTHPPSRNRLQSLNRLIEEEQLDSLQLSNNKTRFEQYVD